MSANLLDLWAEPRYNSERASQLLYGEALKIIAEKDGFLKVAQIDNYTGWADKRFLTESSEKEFGNPDRPTNFIVKTAQAKLLDEKQASAPPHFLYYGTKLKGTKSKNGLIAISLPDSGKAQLKPQNLKPINRKEHIVGQNLVKEAQKWLGVPYLWGGITPAGFDCSGFVRQVFAQFSVFLPRDTKDQINAGSEIDRDCIMAGDLIFFKRHVGIAMNKNQLIHCSLGSNGVRIQSIVQGESDYRGDLDQNYATARRII